MVVLKEVDSCNASGFGTTAREFELTIGAGLVVDICGTEFIEGTVALFG